MPRQRPSRKPLLSAARAFFGSRTSSRSADAPFGEPRFRVEVTRDVAYGRARNNLGVMESLLLDLYAPAGDASNARPVIVWAHGGAFSGGAKNDPFISMLASRFAERGWVTASIEYRRRPRGTPGAPNADHLRVGPTPGSPSDPRRDAQYDMQAAVRWFRANRSTLRIDVDRIVAGGISSGAMMALDAAFNPRDPGASGSPDERSDVAAVVSIAGAAPVDGIDTAPPPITMFHGVHDPVVPYEIARRTCDDVRSRRGVCELQTYTESRHILSQHADDIVERTSAFLCRYVVVCG